MSPSCMPRSTIHSKRPDSTEQPTRSAELSIDLAKYLDTTFFLAPPHASESGSVHHSEEPSGIHSLSSIELTSLPGTAIGVMSSGPGSGVMKMEDIDLPKVSATSKASIENSDSNDSENWEQGFSNLKNGNPRLIRDDNGNGPFSKRHIVTKSPKAPFSGPHTAISITDGPDRGKWLHVTHKLSKEEAVFAMTEIFWLWNIRDNITTGNEVHGGSPASKELAAQLYKSINNSNWKLLGPPGARFPLTTSIDAPFAGPRTVVLNCGIFFNGWHLHIPRLLTSEQMAIAQSNLGELCMNRWDWGSDNEESSGSALNKMMADSMASIKAIQNQRKVADFLENNLGFDFSAQDIDHAEKSAEEPVWVTRNLKYFVHLNKLESVSQTQSDNTLSTIGSVSGFTLSFGKAAGDYHPSASFSIRHGDLQVYHDLEFRELQSPKLNIQSSVSGFTPSFSETGNGDELVTLLQPEAGITEQMHKDINVGVIFTPTSPTSPELGLCSLRSVSRSTLSLGGSTDERGLIVNCSTGNAILNIDGTEAKCETHISNTNMDLFTTQELLGSADGELDPRTVEVIDSHKPNRHLKFPFPDAKFSHHVGVELDLLDDEDSDSDTLNSNIGTIFFEPDCPAQLPAALRCSREILEKGGDVKTARKFIFPIVETSGCGVMKSSIITEIPELTSQTDPSNPETPPRDDNVQQSTTEYQRLRACYEDHTVTSDLHDQLSIAGTDKHKSTIVEVSNAEIHDILGKRGVLLLEMVSLLEEIAQDLNTRQVMVGPAPKVCNPDNRQKTAFEEQDIVESVESSARLHILLGILPWFLYLSLGFYKNIL